MQKGSVSEPRPHKLDDDHECQHSKPEVWDDLFHMSSSPFLPNADEMKIPKKPKASSGYQQGVAMFWFAKIQSDTMAYSMTISRDFEYYTQSL